MHQNGIELSILVKDRPINEFLFENKTFVEGRAGSNYELVVRNSRYHQVEAVISVDGLSVTDGKAAGSDSRGYLIAAQRTIHIPGWLLDSQSAAKFAFAGKRNSYASKMSAGETHNNGVIGVLAYAPKPPPISYPIYDYHYNAAPFCNSILSNTAFRGSASASASASTSASASAASDCTSKGVNFCQQSLGTAFGEQTEFATRTVAFERGTSLAMLTIYYDSLKGLRDKGVPIERINRKQQAIPNAFPGLAGCVPPADWRG